MEHYALSMKTSSRSPRRMGNSRQTFQRDETDNDSEISFINTSRLNTPKVIGQTSQKTMNHQNYHSHMKVLNTAQKKVKIHKCKGH